MIKKQSVFMKILVLSLLFHFLFVTSFATNESFRNIHVAKSGSDANDGSAKAPLLTINKAGSIAHPGDNIIVHTGIYREMIVLTSGGTTQHDQITYKAAPGNEVIIKGSEIIKSWIRVNTHTWQTAIDENFFGKFNPFAELINTNSSFLHLGEVYLENHPLKEKKDISQVDSTEGTWFTKQENGKTVIIANFGQADPNIKLTEINVRPASFVAINPGIHYVVIDGFRIAQMSSPMSSIDGTQSGAISVNGGSYWLIQNCILSDCKSVAISIGQTGHPYPGAGPGKPQYSDLSQDIKGVGHHIIRHNHIFRCGQAGIFGLLHGSFSEITDNLIEDINIDNEFPAEESAGIRLALAIDTKINHNLIRRVNGNLGGYGIFLGPLFQGTTITRNIISDTRQSCIYLFNSHGPALISNNILYGPGKETKEGVKLMSAEANVFVQNLFYNCGWINSKTPGRSFATSNYLPHSLVIKQTIPALPIDDRWYCNLFIKAGLDQLSGTTHCEADYNVYLYGAAVSSWGSSDKYSKIINHDPNFKLVHSSTGISLEFDDRLIPAIKSPLLGPNFIGFFTLSKQYIEYPDGKPITIDKDFYNTTSNKPYKLTGPFYKYPAVNSKRFVLFTY